MILYHIRATYRWFLSWIGKYWLDKALNNGLPERFRLPLLFLLGKSLSEEERLVTDRIEVIRSQIANRKEVYVDIYTSPNPISADTISSPIINLVPGEVKTVPLARIANVTSILPYWGTFLYLCANANQAKTILELGSCAGISGCYMASGKFCNKFITIEGSRELAKLAELNIRQVTDNYVCVNALFDDGLDKILPTLKSKFDMVYIDGQHEKNATFHYFEILIPYLNKDCIIVFDDIYWTPDMWEAWQTLCQWKGVSHTLNLGRFGVCVWDGETNQPKNYNFSMFTALWNSGKPKN